MFFILHIFELSQKTMYACNFETVKQHQHHQMQCSFHKQSELQPSWEQGDTPPGSPPSTHKKWNLQNNFSTAKTRSNLVALTCNLYSGHGIGRYNRHVGSASRSITLSMGKKVQVLCCNCGWRVQVQVVHWPWALGVLGRPVANWGQRWSVMASHKFALTHLDF